MNRNYNLEIFRGFAALLVCLGHFYDWNHIDNVIPISFVLAVDFFLVLSGYVISKSVFEKKFNIFVFSINRWLRLFPVFIFCYIAIAIPKIYFLEKYTLPDTLDITKIMLIGHMLPFNENSTYKDPLSIAYTISIELWVGLLIFPIIYYIHKKLRKIFLLILILISLIFLIKNSPNYMSVSFEKYNPYIYFGMMRGTLDYSLGILTYLATKGLNLIIKLNLLELF